MEQSLTCIEVFHATSCNAQARYFPDKLRFTGGKRVVGCTAILETRGLTYVVPQLLLSSSF